MQKWSRYISNLPGWRTNRKIMVIESDDWGSIRMPSLKVYERLKKKGLDVDSGDSWRYNTNDTLASAEDLEALFCVLTKFRDFNGSHPIFTAVSLTSNPDFERIQASGYQEYFHEPFTKTLEKYNQSDTFELWKQGNEEKLFHPEFHGREHLNVNMWMRHLRSNERFTQLGFEEGMWGFNNSHYLGMSYQAAFDVEFSRDIENQKKVIKSGLDEFEQLHHYRASFFVPPNGPFNNSLEEVAANSGIRFMSSAKIQNEALGEGQTKRRFHYLGQKNKYNQRYITRNCFFEPSDHSKNWVDSCLKEMEIAFTMKKPAVISSHRVNYIGGLRIENRNHGLNELTNLLHEALKRWPNIEFMTSTQLGELISSND